MDITEKLKDCPKGMKLYSRIIGDCKFFDVLDLAGEKMVRVYKDGVPDLYWFRSNGTYRVKGSEIDGECMLFINDDCEIREWEICIA